MNQGSDDQFGYNGELELEQRYSEDNTYHVLQNQVQSPLPPPHPSRRSKIGGCLLSSCKFTTKATVFLAFLLLFAGVIFWGYNLTKDVNLHFELQRNLKIEIGGVHAQIKDLYHQLNITNGAIKEIQDQLETLKSDPLLSVSISQGTNLTEE